MLRIFSLIVICSANVDLSAKLSLEEAEKLTGSDLSEYLRKHQTLFQVHESAEARERKQFFMDSKFLVAPDDKDRIKIKITDDEVIPDRFDAREAWPECAHLIGKIRDQTRCGSCWAVSAASVMTDRACVQSRGRVQAFLSDTDILSCCGNFCGYGCKGGYDIRAWEYITISGICTGGPYGTKGACKPYVFHPCGKHRNQTYYGECPARSYETPKCSTICQRGYGIPYKKDKIYAKNFYWLPKDEKAIRKEIMTNGPVQASFDTYDDLDYYQKGVYEHTAGGRSGGHAIRIIGWGKDNVTGVDYWLIANSWNVDWGEDGYFRMIRGTNNCRLEELVKAGMMDV